MNHYSTDHEPVTVGAKFWDNDLRVVQITNVAWHSNAYADSGCTQTWHRHTRGISDTLDGSMEPYGRLARRYAGLDAEKYEPGTRFADVSPCHA